MINRGAFLCLGEIEKIKAYLMLI